MNIKEYECEYCGAWIPVDMENVPQSVDCPVCAAKYKVSVDAEQVNGTWKDLTMLVKEGATE